MSYPPASLRHRSAKPGRTTYWWVDRLDATRWKRPIERLCSMDFGYDAKTLDLRKQLLTFMEERVYPAEAVFAEQAEAAAAQGQGWERVPVTTDLKAEARSRGLWN